MVNIGLGRFGTSVCQELNRLGHEILATDLDEEKVNAISAFVTQAVVANGTDENMLKELGVRNFANAIVAIGDNLQSSVLCTLMLKERGITNIWVKARDLQHQKILEKVGADRVIQPEYEMGIRVAHHMDSEKIIDYIDLSKDYSIFELVASIKIANKTLLELDIRTKYNCSILALKRGRMWIKEEIGTNKMKPGSLVYARKLGFLSKIQLVNAVAFSRKDDSSLLTLIKTDHLIK